MPVWHETTRAWREDGRLVVLGLAQEQHPERCELFADWQRFDWPILWDPFHLTGSAAVPNVFAIDEHGVLRSTRPSPEWLRDAFLDVTFPPPAGATDGDASPDTPHATADGAAPTDVRPWPVRPGGGPIAEILFAPDADARAAALDRHLPALRAHAEAHGEDGAAWFRLGVAHRMRFDGPRRRDGDFQAALDAWRAALDRDPGVYIWRRRIQQYGPRMDKPYPFYDWVDEAVAALEARGAPVPDWPGRLTAAERAMPRRELAPAEDDGTPPDPQGRVPRAGDTFRFSGAAAWDSSGDAPLARVHLAWRPAPDGGWHWNNEAGPLEVWLGDPDLPAGTVVERRRLVHDGAPTGVVSDEPRRLEFELRLPDDAREPVTLTGYALFHACSDEDGTCVYRRADFALPLVPPGGDG